MKKSLVLAEKPSVARDIARVLGCQGEKNGFMEGKQYVVTWALGHLVTHAMPEQYDPKYKEWKMEHLPMVPQPFKLVPIPQTRKQFQTVQRLLRRDDIETVIIATDAGREGELVARWTLEKAKSKKPIKRLWISSVTDKAIRDGFKSLQDGHRYDNLYAAAEARAEADWIVGLNATRALTVKHDAQLSAGRVQTPTLAMVAMREQQVKNFRPKPYYGLTATTSRATFVWEDQNGNKNTFHEKLIDNCVKTVKNEEEGHIRTVQTKKKTTPAPPLFDLTSLQREAFTRWNWGAKETLNTLQHLYERHKAVTYPRTDSQHLTSDMKQTLRERLEALDGGTYRREVARLLRQKEVTIKRGVINDNKVTDHHAIIPTEEAPFLGDLSNKERDLYDLITERFLAQFLGDYTYDEQVATLDIAGESFRTKEQIPTSLGWKSLFQELSTTKRTSYVEGETLPIRSIQKTEGLTTPPPYFNEGTLLGAMENPIRFMTEASPEMKKTLKEAGGIGTVATRAEIIERLYQTFVIEKRGNAIHTTSKGKQLLELVPEDLKSPALTAEWEDQLVQIERGQLKKQDFIKEMVKFTENSVNEIKNTDIRFKHDNVTGSPCPECGEFLLRVKTKRGERLVCQDRNCGYKKNVKQRSNARCPQCHKKMDLYGEGEGKTFICSCGHREKLSAFKKRKSKQQGNRADRRTVNQYMKKQKKEEIENPAMAEALKKLFGDSE